MDDDQGRSRIKTFLLGGLVGASAVLAAVRRQQEPPQTKPRRGLAAFEDAPCFREELERERSRPGR